MRPSQKGFSLIEIMIALVIGMISMVVIMQVFYVSEGRKRTTTGGADAQANGAVAFYMIERDVRMAGWGIDTNMLAGCDSAFSYCDGSAACGGAAGPLAGLTFAAVKVTDGGTDPDTITAQYFADPNLDTFRYPSPTTIRSDMPQSSSELNVESLSGCADGNLALASQAGKCTLMQVTQTQGSSLKIQHNPGESGIYNPPIVYQKDNGWPAYTKGAKLTCFKQPAMNAVFQRTYSVDKANRILQRSDNTGTTPVVNELAAPEIMDMQVEYGVAPAGSQSVSEWVPATGAWANPPASAWKRIKAVRMALVARSTQYEKPEPNTVCATTTAAMADGWSEWATFDTTTYPADWSCYRYKVFQTVVPLRNVLWGKT